MFTDRDFNYREFACLADTALEIAQEEIDDRHNRTVAIVTHEINPLYPVAIRSFNPVTTFSSTLIDHAIQLDTAYTSSRYAANTGKSASELNAYLKEKKRNARCYGMNNDSFPPRSVFTKDGFILTVVSAGKEGHLVPSAQDVEIAKMAISRTSLGKWNADITWESKVVADLAERLNKGLPPDRSGAVMLAYDRGIISGEVEKAVPLASQSVRCYDPRAFEIVAAKCRDTVNTKSPSKEPSGIRGALPIKHGYVERVIGVGGFLSSEDDLALIAQLESEGTFALSIIDKLSGS